MLRIKGEETVGVPAGPELSAPGDGWIRGAGDTGSVDGRKAGCGVPASWAAAQGSAHSCFHPAPEGLFVPARPLFWVLRVHGEQDAPKGLILLQVTFCQLSSS